jgi:hypothetical protein
MADLMEGVVLGADGSSNDEKARDQDEVTLSGELMTVAPITLRLL